jgi:hypothetical protein
MTEHNVSFIGGKYMLLNHKKKQDRLDFLHHALLQVTSQLTYVPHPTDAESSILAVE